ncbi:hypothetical protein [Oscillatoria sp. FACHB-1406]|uniref:hypothetical protein n=1 Tax=Oscillatoria sp. FACHB-1406 TaxID=2692846 RepID=UPI001A7E9E33|nr:hypothetical protein [Oscillatoria sp. FACHB-1406]
MGITHPTQELSTARRKSDRLSVRCEGGAMQQVRIYYEASGEGFIGSGAKSELIHGFEH